MRIQAHHYSRRQDDTLTVPTAAGLGAAQTAAATATAVNSLLVDADPAAATGASVTADLVVGSSALVVTSTGAADSTLPTASASHSASAAAGSSSKSGLGTGPMIGIIIAAFAGVLLIILVVYFSLRRRWASALDKAQQERQAQPWAKLDEDGNGNGNGNDNDKWEGMEKKSASTTRSNTTKSVDTNVHRLSLFRKASSTRSGFEDNKSRLNQFDPSTMPNFATYHPDLAAELANTPVVPPARPFAVTRDTNSERTTGGTDSFLSLRLSDSSFGGGALVKTVPPPSAAVPALHRWESAEVLTMDGESMYATTSNADSSSPLAQHAASTNPFADDISASELGRSKSGRNPFFGGSNENPFADQRRRSRATSEVNQNRQSEDAPSLYPYPYSVDAGVAVPPLVMRRSSTSSVETVRAGPVRPDSSVRPLSNQQGSGSAGMQGLLAALQDGEQGKRGSYASSYQRTERSSVGSWGGTAM